MAGTIICDTLNTATPSSGPGSVLTTNNAYLGIAKAWVNFAGSTGTINASFNVGYVTYNSTGNYTINFTTAMANSNYAAHVQITDSGTFNRQYGMPFNGGLYSTTQLQIQTVDGVTANNNPRVCVSVFGN